MVGLASPCHGANTFTEIWNANSWLKAIRYMRDGKNNALHELIIFGRKKVKKSWPAFEPAIFRLEGHWGDHYTVAAWWLEGQIYKA